MYGTKISSIRTARGYAQEYVASRLGIAQNTYSKIERDETKKLDEEMMQKLAEVLGVLSEDIKSPTPVVMTFHNSPQSGQYNTHLLQDEKVIEAFVDQLKVKDEQIAQQNKLIQQLLSRIGQLPTK